MFGLGTDAVCLHTEATNRNRFMVNGSFQNNPNVVSPLNNYGVVIERMSEGLLPHSTPATLYWLRNNYEQAEGISIPRYIIYDNYKDFCRKYRIAPVNPACLGKILKQVFPHVSTRRLGNRNRSKYHYFGIGIKVNSCYSNSIYSVKHSSGWSGNSETLISLPKLSRGMLLLEFPNIKDFSLPSDSKDTIIQVSGFITMYRAHCQRIYDSILLSNLNEVKSFIHHFWKGVPLYLMPKMSSCGVVNTIGVCDSVLYRTIISVLMSSFLQCLNRNLSNTIQEFANSLEPWLQTALVHMPRNLCALKMKIAQWFIRMLRRQLVLTGLCCNIKTVMKDTSVVNQMLMDWKTVDLTSIQRDTKHIALSCYDEDKNSLLIDLLCLKFNEYSKLLESQVPIESLTQWLDSIVEQCVVQLAGKFHVPLLQWARYFLMIWVAYDSKIDRDLTLSHSKTVGSFHMLNIMTSDYLQQSIDLLFLEEVTNCLQHSLPLDNHISNFFQKMDVDMSGNEAPTHVYESECEVEEINTYQDQESLINNSNYETVPFSPAAVMTVSHDLLEYGLNIFEATQTIYSQHDYLNENRLPRRNETITGYVNPVDLNFGNYSNTPVSPEYLETMFLEDWNTNSMLNNSLADVDRQIV